MADWSSRVRGSISLISPNGIRFDAKFQKDTMNGEKKIGLFDMPNFRGTIGQDLGVKGFRYDFPIFFDGESPDLMTKQFLKSTEEKGTWQVVHPVNGFMKLLLISFSVDNDPTRSGGLYKINTNWIHTENFIKRSNYKNDSLSFFSENETDGLLSFDFKDASSMKRKSLEFAEKITNLLSPVFELNAEINAQVLGIYNGIKEYAESSEYNALSVAGQFQNLVKLPSLIKEDIDKSIESFQAMTDSVFEMSPETANDKNFGIAKMQELVLGQTINGLGYVLLNSDFSNRKTAIDTIDRITTLYDKIVNKLDEISEIFANQNLEDTYFSQSKTYTSGLYGLDSAISYVLNNVFNLSIEKTIIISEPIPAIGLCINEYGTLGENDENFDFFIKTNGLTGEEILELPVGREIVIYV